MLVTLINNSYSAYLSLNRWYWSAPNQQRLLDTTANIVEITLVMIVLLSQAWEDFTSLIDQWLTYGCDNNVFVITDHVRYVGIDWWEVWAMLLGDVAYAQTWIGYTWNDTCNIVSELHYRIKGVIQC